MSRLRIIQLDVADRLSRDPYYWANSIPVFSPVQNDFSDRMAIAVKTIGCCAIVSIPSANSESPDSMLFLGDALLMVHCLENRSLNVSKTLTAEDMAENAAIALHQYRTEDLHECLIFKRFEDLLPATEGKLVYREIALTFGTSINITNALTTTATPTITQGATTTAITGASGASFRYTLDGTNPTYASTLYAAAFTNPTPGVVVTARAFKTGETASASKTATIT